jgi:predicted DNA-binding antitoxin AbrB/MazE fold protein
MIQRINATFENGVFRPSVPVNIAEGQNVSLAIEKLGLQEELRDVEDLLDREFVESCRQNVGSVVPIPQLHKILEGFSGNLAESISAERDER